MTANTIISIAQTKAELLRAIEITDVADVTFPGFDNQGEYVYGAYTFFSPEVAPATGDYVILSDSGANGLLKAAKMSSDYDILTSGSTITDSTGGTASNTLAAISVATPADLAAQAAINAIIRNALASLARKVNGG